MKQVEAVKTCASCGVDLMHQDCFRNSSGEYRCIACYERTKNALTPTADTSKANVAVVSEPGQENLKHCVLCDARVDRAHCHKNRHGKYVCHTCRRKAGKRRAWRRSTENAVRWIVKFGEKLALWVAYACFIAVCLWLFFNVMGRLAAPPVME